MICEPGSSPSWLGDIFRPKGRDRMSSSIGFREEATGIRIIGAYTTPNRSCRNLRIGARTAVGRRRKSRGVHSSSALRKPLSKRIPETKCSAVGKTTWGESVGAGRAPLPRGPSATRLQPRSNAAAQPTPPAPGCPARAQVAPRLQVLHSDSKEHWRNDECILNHVDNIPDSRRKSTKMRKIKKKLSRFKLFCGNDPTCQS